MEEAEDLLDAGEEDSPTDVCEARFQDACRLALDVADSVPPEW